MPEKRVLGMGWGDGGGEMREWGGYEIDDELAFVLS